MRDDPKLRLIADVPAFHFSSDRTYRPKVTKGRDLPRKVILHPSAFILSARQDLTRVAVHFATPFPPASCTPPSILPPETFPLKR
jgi:hypothetical protein